MLMVSICMATVFKKGQAFHKLSNQQHIISNFQQIKEMLLVNGVMASVFEMGQAFHKI
jgi:hypothetical protein